MTDGNLPAVGETGFEAHAIAPFDNRDLVTSFAEEVGRGDTDHPAAEDDNLHAVILFSMPAHAGLDWIRELNIAFRQRTCGRTSVSDDILYMPASELVGRYRDRSLSPVDVTRATLDRISAIDERTNAYVVVDSESAMEAAQASEKRWRDGKPMGLVDGVPCSVKDLVLAKGWPTLFGSKTTDTDQAWDADAPCVARLREHGAVILGKTTTPEFGWKGVTDSAVSGITRNPWNLEKTPGGSSGGAGAAVAAGMCHLAIGTDGGGSIRIPSGFSGTFGLKPSFGRVPAWPAGRFGTLGHVGPMTRTVEDAALMLTVISQPDPRDWAALPYDPRDYRDGLDRGLEGLRVAFTPDLGYADVDSEISEIVTRAAESFSYLGAEIVHASPGLEDPKVAFRTLWWAGAANGLRGLTDRQMKLVEPDLADVVEEGRKIPLFDHIAADHERAVLGELMMEFHQTYDLLLTPSLAVAAFEVGTFSPREADDPKWITWSPFTYPFNMTKQPAASVPCGFTADGLPVGLQIVGPMFADHLVLRASHAYQREFPLTDRRPPI